MKIQEKAEYYAHNYCLMHETNNYKALKQGFEAGAYWALDNNLYFPEKEMFVSEDKHTWIKRLVIGRYNEFFIAKCLVSMEVNFFKYAKETHKEINDFVTGNETLEIPQKENKKQEIFMFVSNDEKEWVCRKVFYNDEFILAWDDIEENFYCKWKYGIEIDDKKVIEQLKETFKNENIKNKQ